MNGVFPPRILEEALVACRNRSTHQKIGPPPKKQCKNNSFGHQKEQKKGHKILWTVLWLMAATMMVTVRHKTG